MPDLVEANGMVIASIQVGEYDKRITLLTKELGKIHVFVRGAKRPNSRFAAVTDPFVFGSFGLYQGKSAYTLAHAKIKSYFEEVRKDLDAVYYGSYFLEIADYFGRENLEASAQLNLLYLTMNALTKDRFDKRLVRSIYELRTLMINGLQPDVFHCRICGNTQDLIGFSIRHHGSICGSCKRPDDLIVYADATSYTMQYILTVPLTKLYAFTVSEEVCGNLQLITERLIHTSIDRNLKSAALLP